MLQFKCLKSLQWWLVFIELKSGIIVSRMFVNCGKVMDGIILQCLCKTLCPHCSHFGWGWGKYALQAGVGGLLWVSWLFLLGFGAVVILCHIFCYLSLNRPLEGVWDLQQTALWWHLEQVVSTVSHLPHSLFTSLHLCILDGHKCGLW